MVGDEYLSPAAQVLVHGINQALGNVGTTVFYQEPVEADPVDHVQSIAELVRDMNAGQVTALLILDGVNPVYTAPADLPFKAAMEKVQLRVHHGLYPGRDLAVSATGTSRPPTSSRAGGTPAPSTAR